MRTGADTELDAFVVAFERMSRAAKRARVRVDAEAALTPSQIDLVLPLYESDDALGLRELARAAGVSPPTATRMIAGLEDRGLVTREPAPGDRRAVRLALTDAGRAAVAEQRARTMDRRRAVFERLAPAERRAAAQVMRRLADAFEELT